MLYGFVPHLLLLLHGTCEYLLLSSSSIIVFSLGLRLLISLASRFTSNLRDYASILLHGCVNIHVTILSELCSTSSPIRFILMRVYGGTLRRDSLARIIRL